jgi:hypothetical protein
MQILLVHRRLRVGARTDVLAVEVCTVAETVVERSSGHRRASCHSEIPPYIAEPSEVVDLRIGVFAITDVAKDDRFSGFPAVFPARPSIVRWCRF